MSLELPGIGQIDDPVGFGRNDSALAQAGGPENMTIGTIVDAAIPYVIGFAGLILFLMIIAGGFMLLTSAGNDEKVKKGQGLIVSALLGFVIIFVAYWIMQMLEYILGINFGFGGV